MTRAGDSIVRFEFATATRILFGAGTLHEVGPLARQMGSRALVVTGRNTSRAEPLLSLLEAEKICYVIFPVAEEPSVDVVRDGVQRAREERCELVIGFGGGSALDAGKAIAAMLTNPGELLDYLEVIGQAKPLTQPAAPFIAIPTTAGTGTEVTRNAVLASPSHRVKVSLRSPFLLPHLAVVDPELTYDLPPAITANTGLDALTQLIEPFTCTRANPLTDAICVQGLRRVACSLRRAFQHSQMSLAIDPSRQSQNNRFEYPLPSSREERGQGEGSFGKTTMIDDFVPSASSSIRETEWMAAREDMMLASLLGGLALANAGLGAVHGFANPIGGMFTIPHGAVCAALLPHVMEINLRALRARAPAGDVLRRYDHLARLLTGKLEATGEEGVGWVRDLCAELQIAPLKVCSPTQESFSALVEKATQASSMKSNPIVLTRGELEEILARAADDRRECSP